MNKSKILRNPYHGDNTEWLNINDIPTDQRGSLYVWLEANKLSFVIHSANSTKKDELGLAIGCKWASYVRWYIQWDGNIIFPAMLYKNTGETLCITECDERLTKDGDKKDLLALRAKLLSFMLEPYKHETIKLKEDSSKIYTWYELEKDLEDSFNLMQSNVAYSKIFMRLRNIAQTLTNELLKVHYNYYPYDGEAS